MGEIWSQTKNFPSARQACNREALLVIIQHFIFDERGVRELTAFNPGKSGKVN